MVAVATVLAAVASAADDEPQGSTSYDLPAVRRRLEAVLETTRAKMDSAPSPPGAHPTPNLTFQLGFVSDSGEVTVQVGADGRSGRNITERDTFLFGSGTKSFIAARIFQHIEAGELSLSSLVDEQVDPILRAINDTSLVELLGEPARAITVGSLLRMSSGLGVWETTPFDDMCWDESRADPLRLFPPLEFLEHTHCEHFGHRNASSCASTAMDCWPGKRNEPFRNLWKNLLNMTDLCVHRPVPPVLQRQLSAPWPGAAASRSGVRLCIAQQRILGGRFRLRLAEPVCPRRV